MRLQLILAGVIFAALSSAALAQGTQEEKDACRPDVRRFCSKVDAGAGDQAFADCLAKQRDKLSAKCKQAMAGYNP